jgi:trehalose/maltose hydrolase-like predicted phosphorylase
VFPALMLVDPERARAITDYRLARLGQAQANFQGWLAQGRPTGASPLGPVPQFDLGGAKFPWESSVSGRETVPGPSRFQDHIIGSVAFAVAQAGALGLTDPVTEQELRGDAALFYMLRSTDRGDDQLHIEGTMSPDEHHTGNNDLYTNLLADWVTLGWSGPEPTHRLPRDGTTFLTYDDDHLRAYKQAAAVLAIYPLQYPPAEKEARLMMERFADKVIDSGPAMSDSIHALIWARMGEREKAYQVWHDSWKEFTKAPLMLFSEKRVRPVAYFTTGAAGSLQTVLYGFLGFRLDSEQEPEAVWSKKLLGDRWLSVKPNLPPKWNSVKFKNFTVFGERYTLLVTPTTAQVTQGD